MGARKQPKLERGRRAASGELRLLLDNSALTSEAGNRRIIQLRAIAAHDAGGRPVVDVAAPAVALFALDERSPTAKLREVPEWIELIPAPRDDADEGHVETRDWRPGFIVKDMQALADGFNSKPAQYRAAIVDWEHKTHRNWGGQKNPAAGWIEEAEVRDRALWGRIRWTEDGYQDVEKLNYRYISPVIGLMWPADSEGRIDWDAIPEATELIDAALTNSPATYIRDLATTPTESENSSDGDAQQLASSIDPGPARARDQDQQKSETDAMKLSNTTLQALGLSAEATPEQIDAAIIELVAERKHDADELVERITANVKQSFAAELAERDKKIEELLADRDANSTSIRTTQVNSVLTDMALEHRFAPAERDDLVKLGADIGAERLRELLSKRPSLAHLHTEVGQGKGPEQKPKITLTKEQRMVMEQMQLSEAEFIQAMETEVAEKDAAA